MKFRFILAIAALLMPSAVPAAESLEAWIIQKLEADEQLIRDSITQTNGQDLEVLKTSTWYLPFFLEAPQNIEASTPKARGSLQELLRVREGFLPGGYIHRLSFKNAPPLYALSAGLWEENGAQWHCLETGKDFRIDVGDVWEGEGEELYVTMISGNEPRLLAYGKDGAVAKDEPFDLNAADFDQRWEDTKSLYAKRRTTRETIPLAEYLQVKTPTWRKLVVSGRIHLRNQQQRKEEKILLPKIPPMNRATALSVLKKRAEAK